MYVAFQRSLACGTHWVQELYGKPPRIITRMIARITNELMIEHERQKALQQAAARNIDYNPDVDLEDSEVGNMILYWLNSGRIKVRF